MWTYVTKDIAAYNIPAYSVRFSSYNALRLALYVGGLIDPNQPAKLPLVLSRLTDLINRIDLTNLNLYVGGTHDEVIDLNYEVSIRVKALAELIGVDNIDILTERVGRDEPPFGVTYQAIYALSFNDYTFYL
jgi:hypothetical protein